MAKYLNAIIEALTAAPNAVISTLKDLYAALEPVDKSGVVLLEKAAQNPEDIRWALQHPLDVVPNKESFVEKLPNDFVVLFRDQLLALRNAECELIALLPPEELQGSFKPATASLRDVVKVAEDIRAEVTIEMVTRWEERFGS